MAEAPKRKTRSAEPEEVTVEVRRKTSPKRRVEADYRIDLGTGDVVEYGGMTAVVTGVSKRNGTVYLDSPVCRWVPAAECAKA